MSRFDENFVLRIRAVADTMDGKLRSVAQILLVDLNEEQDYAVKCKKTTRINEGKTPTR